MSDHEVPLAVVRHIILKLLTNKNMKPAKILMRLESTVWWWNALKNPGVRLKQVI